jgi:hypothetical protein
MSATATQNGAQTTLFHAIGTGNVLSESQFYTVVKKLGNKVQLQNDQGDNIVVDSNYVNNQLQSANQYSAEEKITKTKLAEIFLQHPRVAMTVCFNKQIKQEDIAKEISGIYSQLNVGLTQDQFDRKVKAALNLKGEERVMVGRHYGGTDINGRVHFIDMGLTRDTSKSYDTRQRLVDPRTINYIIVGGTKYQLK